MSRELIVRRSSVLCDGLWCVMSRASTGRAREGGECRVGSPPAVLAQGDNGGYDNISHI